MSRKCLEVFDKLVEKAAFRAVFASRSDKMKMEISIGEGKGIPEKCKPGALLNELTMEEREDLKQLTSDMTRSYRPL
jgi:hypothetical protein